MAYTKVHEDWQDSPSTATPILAADLEHIEQGIFDAAATADAIPATNDPIVAALVNDPASETGTALSVKFEAAIPSAIARDASGRIVSVTENGVTESYTRDALGQIVTVARNGATYLVERTPLGQIEGTTLT